MGEERLKDLIKMANARLLIPQRPSSEVLEKCYEEDKGINRRYTPTGHINAMASWVANDRNDRFAKAHSSAVDRGSRQVLFDILDTKLNRAIPPDKHPEFYKWLELPITFENTDKIFERCRLLRELIEHLRIFARDSLVYSPEFAVCKNRPPVEYQEYLEKRPELLTKKKDRIGRIKDGTRVYLKRDEGGGGGFEYLKITAAGVAQRVVVSGWLDELDGLPVGRVSECPICGDLFLKTRKDKSACADRCRNTLNVRRKRADLSIPKRNRSKSLRVTRHARNDSTAPQPRRR